jgi:hypothetical protein
MRKGPRMQQDHSVKVVITRKRTVKRSKGMKMSSRINNHISTVEGEGEGWKGGRWH